MHRRTVLGSAVAGALAGVVPADRPAAQGADLAGHPLAGAWLAMANPPDPADPPFAAPSFFYADGTVLLVFPPIAAGPRGVQMQSNVAGVWEADGERAAHFTAVQALADADGSYLGTVTINGHPDVSADGQSFVDADPRSTVTIRNAAGVVVMEAPAVGERPVTATRMAPGAPGFPATPAAGTPTG